MSTYACFDLETTRLDSHVGHIIEIAVVVTEDDGTPVGEEWATLVNAGTTDVGRTDIHGIRADWLPDAPSFADIAGDLAEQLSGHIPVAHNKNFDVRFLVEEWRRAGLGKLDLQAVDTIPMARALGLPGKLGLLAAALGVPLDDAHQALGDTRALAGVLVAMLKRGANPSPCPVFDPPLLTPNPTGWVLHRPAISH
ncbi:MAG: 3'-5' exonuclease [Actinomycetota bacterium]|nr:3'-5' exonuclease [Actinomycetota bacterium]